MKKRRGVISHICGVTVRRPSDGFCLSRLSADRLPQLFRTERPFCRWLGSRVSVVNLFFVPYPSCRSGLLVGVFLGEELLG